MTDSAKAADRSNAPRSVRRAIEDRVSRGGKSLIPFLTAGYPSWQRCDAAIRIMAGAGADALELGIPFSDPLADGPVIQASSQRALEEGVTLRKILSWIKTGSSDWSLPIVLMTYANPILAYGIDRFAEDAGAAGVSGVLVSDLPPEELPELWQALDRAKLERIVLVAPTTSADRIPKLAAAATGFVYCVTRTGITGKGASYARNLAQQVERVRRSTDLPIVAGFGIREPGDVRALEAEVDGIVVGTRCVELLGQESEKNALRSLEDFLSSLRQALDGPPLAMTPEGESARAEKPAAAKGRPATPDPASP